MKGLFDIEKSIKESGLSEQEIKKIKQEVRKEFPDDEMMWELHVIRAIKSKQQEKLKKPKRQAS